MASRSVRASISGQHLVQLAGGRMFSIFTFLFFILTYVYCKEATLRARITTSGLQFFSDIGHHVVDYEVRQLVFPQISIPIDGGIGSGKVDINNLKIDHIDSPSFNFKLAPPDGIAWKSQGGVVKVSGNWEAMYKILFPIYMSGSVRAVADDIRVLLQARFFVRDNHPQVDIDSCSVSIMKLDVDIGGGFFPWIVNLFRPEVSRIVKSVIHDQLCTSLQTVLLDEANEALMSIPMHIRAIDKVYVNYLFSTAPLATTDYIEGEIYSDVVYGDNSCTLEAKPMDKNIVDPGRMVHVWLSEHIPNCLLLSAHENRLLSFSITKDFDNGKFEKFMSTSCSVLSLCIGRFLPTLSSKYPNQHVDFHFESAAAPDLDITSSGILATTVLNLDLFLSPWQQQTERLARLGVITTMILEPQLINDKITGHVKNTTVIIQEKESRIGHFNEKIISVFGKIISQAITAITAPLFYIGIRLPLVDNITLSNNALITTANGYIRVDSDFIYVQ